MAKVVRSEHATRAERVDLSRSVAGGQRSDRSHAGWGGHGLPRAAVGFGPEHTESAGGDQPAEESTATAKTGPRGVPVGLSQSRPPLRVTSTPSSVPRST